MANKPGKRQFGNVRKLDSGRYQASYLGPDGVRRFAPSTFPDERTAGQWLTLRQADLIRGEWNDPDLGPTKMSLRLSTSSGVRVEPRSLTHSDSPRDRIRASASPRRGPSPHMSTRVSGEACLTAAAASTICRIPFSGRRFARTVTVMPGSLRTDAGGGPNRDRSTPL